MRALIVPTLMIFAALLLGESYIWAQPSVTTKDEKYRQLWSAHAAFQAHRKDDFVTPMIVKGMILVHERHPDYSYPDLVATGIALRKEYTEENNYAKTGRLEDPFQAEKRFADWVKKAAPYSKNPLATAIGDGLSASFELGTELADRLTGLDDKQQIEFQSYLYHNAMSTVDSTMKQAAAAAASDKKFADALNDFLEPTLGVNFGETADSIKLKSPEIVTEFQTSEISRLLNAGRQTSESQAAIASQIANIQKQTNLSFLLLKQYLDKQSDAENAARHQAELRTDNEKEKLKIETARSGLNIIGQIIGPSASEDQRHALHLADDGLRAWDAVLQYRQNALNFAGTADDIAGAAFTFQIFNVMADIFRIGTSSMTEEEYANHQILQELNDLKNMISQLYDVTNKRFDKLEFMLESYQMATNDNLQRLMIQNELSAEDLTSIRESLTSINTKLDYLKEEQKQTARSQYQTAFSGYERQCYLDRLTLHTTAVISKKEFEDCLTHFSHFALDVSASRAFSVATPVSLDRSEISNTIDSDPYDNEDYLFKVARSLGSSGAHSEVQTHNANVWSNATMAYIYTLESWPALATDDDFVKLKQLVDTGNKLKTAWESIYSVDCSVSDNIKTVRAGGREYRQICSPHNYEMFEALFKRYSKDIYGLGVAMNNTAIRYAASHTNYINPFSYKIINLEKITPDNDPDFSQHLQTRIPLCHPNSYLPDLIDTPLGITKRINAEVRLAERLDPKGHGVKFCYQVTFGNVRYAHQLAGPLSRFLYSGTPWLTIEIRLEGTSTVMILETALPEMLIDFEANKSDAFPGATNAGDYRSDQLIPGFGDSFYKKAFPEWLATPAFATFSENATKGVRLQEKDIIESKTALVWNPEADDFVTSQLEKSRFAAVEEIENEFSKVGEQQHALQSLSGSKRLLDVFIRSIFPESSTVSSAWISSSYANLYVHDGNLEWQTLLTANRPKEDHGWYRNHWYPGAYGPPASNASELLRYGVEDAVVTGLVGEFWEQYDSVIGKNLAAFHQNLANMVYLDRATTPEVSAVLTVPIGLAESLIAKHTNRSK